VDDSDRALIPEEEPDELGADISPFPPGIRSGGFGSVGVVAPLSKLLIAFRIFGGSCSPKPIPALFPTASPTVTPVVGCPAPGVPKGSGIKPWLVGVRSPLV
jgi:hypothetical protein